MTLPVCDIQKFKGGLVQIEKHGFLYCGQTKAIVVENDELRISLAWCARAKNSKRSKKFVKEDNLSYVINIRNCNVAESMVGEICEKVVFMCGDIIVSFYSPERYEIDREQLGDFIQ